MRSLLVSLSACLPVSGRTNQRIERHRILNHKRPDRSSSQRLQMRAAAKRLAQVACQRSNLRALTAHNVKR
jgi:hypothetical protein